MFNEFTKYNFTNIYFIKFIEFIHKILENFETEGENLLRTVPTACGTLARQKGTFKVQDTFQCSDRVKATA